MATSSSTKDSIWFQPGISSRKSELDLLKSRAKQPGVTPLERRQLYKSISTPCKPEDFHAQLAALADLTHQGKDVTTFENDIIPLITAWLEYWFNDSAAARRREKERGGRGRGPGSEDTALNSIYNYVIDLIRFSFNILQEKDIIILLDQLLLICRKTTTSSDIKSSMQIIDALVTYGDLPRAMLEPCLGVLCGAYSTVKDLMEPIWKTISNLCRSHTAQNTVTALLDILRSPSGHGDQNTNSLRGAFLILKRIWTANGADGLVLVPSSALLDAFQLSLVADSSRLELEFLDGILEVLESPELDDTLFREGDWPVLMSILAQCSRRETSTKTAAPRQGSDRSARSSDYSARSSESLNKVVYKLETYCLKDDLARRPAVMEFFIAISHRLPHTSAELLLRYYSEEHLCYPSNSSWLADSRQLIKTIFNDVKRPAGLRQMVLREIRGVYELVSGYLPMSTVLQLIEPILESTSDETDEAVLEDLKTFVVRVAGDGDTAISDVAFKTLADCLSKNDTTTTGLMENSNFPARISKPDPHWSYGQSQATEMAVVGLAAIFIDSLRSSAVKASRSYLLLLKVVQSRRCNPTARIEALRTLFRIRGDPSGSIYLTSVCESEDLAATLGRTTETRRLLRKCQETPRNRQSRQEKSTSQTVRVALAGTQSQNFSDPIDINRSIDVLSQPAKRDTYWIYEEAYTELDMDSSLPGRVLTSRVRVSRRSSSDSQSEAVVTLNIKLWLEALISILQQEDNWEVYSYVLVHLASQLTNHSLFIDAEPQLQMLRNVLCEQLKVGSYRDPSVSSGLKKSDVMICLYYTLTILLAYHHHFSKNEQDEIVRTFMTGVGSGERTAKYCIHALAICCHELPLSINKALNSILQKMSQIITQSQVAVHILEFLAGLARLQEVYINFREDDYRTIFGVCFRYLQYVRDQRQRAMENPSHRPSTSSENQNRSKRESGPPTENPLSLSSSSSNTAHELPQYVYALAYHVIIFWFMSVRLVDRAKFTGWITKNLVLVDATGKEIVDEQSQVIIDMMQRVTYSDHDETLPDPAFIGRTNEPTSKKSWLVGMSILTVETAVRSGTSQLIKRQPSATTYWIYQSRLAPTPLHQIPISSHTSTDSHDDASRIEVLPSHIMLQLVSTSWRTPATMRPIPLPDDYATTRAINLFDRNSTVDGHKIGVIYLGEGQKLEAEILANVVGSDDFTEFLAQLGTLTRLKGATFNTQGLDREMDMDGEFTFCWRNRVTEIVFHVPIMMPTDLERDPQCTNKKRHTGNDFVNIIFNDSGSAFHFDTFPSEFNYVNIVITPEAKGSRRGDLMTQEQFYKVQVMSKAGFPQISPAAETKVLSGKSLADFVRVVALNASVFSLVWANREGGEYVSSWRNRLREINRLREKHPSTTQAASPILSPSMPSTGVGSGGGTGGNVHSRETSMQRESLGFRRTSGPGFFGVSSGGGGGGDGLSSHRSSVLSTATTATETDAGGFFEGESLAESYDFSKWAS